MANQLDIRLHALKGVDAILAALQTTFSNPKLLGLDETYFYSGDVKTSPVWICDPQSKTGFERGSNRMLITVSRGEFQPNDMHMQNRGQSASFSSSTQSFTDMCTTPVYISCEAGNSVQSEMLASVVYQILKFFRQDLMTEFDLFHLTVSGISSPAQASGTVGSPWITTVSVRLQTQEMFQLTQLTNDVNRVKIVAQIKDAARVLVDEQVVMD